ncbi:MAG: LysE family translocator [Ignavibacteriae bacterium]|nr:MAG: LysE family translocator [Ignavibacteriota bacterium]
MEPIFFLKGLIIGFAMAVPIGPIGIMCIRKTLAEGHSRGLVVGLGAATADSLYGAIAAFGLTFISDMITGQHFWVSLVGGGLLLFLGIRTFRTKRKDPIVPYDNKGLLGSYISAFLLALTNPLTIFAFVAVFAAFGLGHKLVIVSACMLVLGVFAGSCLWFLTLGYVATLFRKKLDAEGIRWVNRISGVLIILSGIAALVSLI